MKTETQDLIQRMTDSLMRLANDERELGRVLMRSSEPERSEIAYFIEDKVNWHPDLPAGAGTSIELVEKFVARRLKLADWHAHCDEIADEWDSLHQSLLVLDEGELDDETETETGDEILNW